MCAPLFGAFLDRFGAAKACTLGTTLLILNIYWMSNIESSFDLVGSLIIGGVGGAGFVGIVLGAVGKLVNNLINHYWQA